MSKATEDTPLLGTGSDGGGFSTFSRPIRPRQTADAPTVRQVAKAACRLAGIGPTIGVACYKVLTDSIEMKNVYN